jgi:hypothetical protein
VGGVGGGGDDADAVGLGEGGGGGVDAANGVLGASPVGGLVRGTSSPSNACHHLWGPTRSVSNKPCLRRWRTHQILDCSVEGMTGR